MLKIKYLFIFILCCTIAEAQHSNIMISNQYDPEEVSICIDPLNTNHLVAGANLDSYYYSTNSGSNWTRGTLSSSYGVWGDPVIACDVNGNFYFLHLSNPSSGNWIDRIVCQKSTNNGFTWNDGSFMGLNGTKAQDKHWPAIDRSNNNIYVTWTEFDEYGTSSPTDSSRILFSKSTNAGQSWSAVKKINKISGDCIDSDNTVEGAVPAVGPNGEIYVSWVGPAGLVFDKSTDEGNSWLADDISVSDVPGGWDYNIPGISRCNGLPITVCDTTNGPYRGNIYINWTDQRNGTTDTDVWMKKSTNGGQTWGPLKRVNDDPAGKQQFFTWMTIDQTTGYLYFVFYDRRNYSDNNTDVYMAISKDGGETFKNFKISQSPFVPNSSVFFGDYTNVTAHNGIVRPIWARLDNYALSVWVALVDTSQIYTNLEEINTPYASLDQNYPNPFSQETAFSFKLHQSCKVSLKVYDMFGREIVSLIDNEIKPIGKHIVTFNSNDYNLTSGVYYFSLILPDKILKKKMIVVR